MDNLNEDSRKWFVLAAIGTSTFMSALDTSVVNSVLPVIIRSLGSDIATIQWVVTIYLLIVSGLLLSFGRLGDLRGHKPIFLLGFGIFILSSAFCGLASSAGWLITFRGLQALGAAMLAANSPAILTKNFPSTQRGQALGLQATMTYLGLMVAPSIGGWLTDLFNWRAVFFINIPVGLLALSLSWLFIPAEEKPAHTERFDLTGALLFLAGLVALLLWLNHGHDWGWITPVSFLSLTIAIGCLIVFTMTEHRLPSPMLDMSLFKDSVFSLSIVSAVLIYMAIFSILFLMPFYLIQGRELNPSQAGLILTIQPLVMAISAPLSGTISDRFGTRVPCILGMGILSFGFFLLTRLEPSTSYSFIAIALGIAGLGIGTFISPNNSAIMGSAPRHRQGIAAAILATARSVGMVLGIGLSGAILTSILSNSSGDEVLFKAVQASFYAAFGVAILGLIVSAVKINNRIRVKGNKNERVETR